MAYNAKVYRKQGGDELIVEDGGKITVEQGGQIDLDGDAYVVVIGSQDALADLDLTASDTYAKTELQGVADKVDAILAVLRTAKIIESV